jgi:uncharacterized repeat protein (TIGR03803 family)
MKLLMVCNYVAMMLLTSAFAGAQTFTVISNFAVDNNAFGPQPGMPPLARDSAGNFYGASPTSANNQNCTNAACGLIYKVDPSGKQTPLYTFKGPPDGSDPVSVVLDEKGDLFGITQYGGTYNLGTIFWLNPAGEETILHSFSGPPDGSNPNSVLTRDAEGNLYGVTPYGGTVDNGTDYTCLYGYGCGIVFKISATGEETILYSFPGGTAGGNPLANLVLAGDTLYGTTEYGGDASCTYPGTSVSGCGVVFALKGKKESVLYTFQGPPDGSGGGYIARDPAGNLYGTSGAGGYTGPNCVLGTTGCGTVWKVAPDGTETVLYSFHEAYGADGFNVEGVIRDPQGNLYGTAESGVVFEVNTADNFSVVYSFGSSNVGAYGPGILIQDNEGNLYGTAPPVLFMITP